MYSTPKQVLHYTDTQFKMSDIESKPKRVMTEEQKAKLKAGREAAKAKREADKVAGIVTPKKEKKADSDASSTTSSKRTLTDEQKAKMKAGREAAKAKREADKVVGIDAPKKSLLTKKIWQALLDEVKKDLKPEFEAYIQSKMN